MGMMTLRAVLPCTRSHNVSSAGCHTPCAPRVPQFVLAPRASLPPVGSSSSGSCNDAVRHSGQANGAAAPAGRLDSRQSTLRVCSALPRPDQQLPDDCDNSDLAADDDIILLASVDEDEDFENFAIVSSSSRSSADSSRTHASDAVQSQGQQVSESISDEEFAAAIAAARQQLVSGPADTAAAEDDWEMEGWSTQEVDMGEPAEDCWSTDKERVYLVGVTYKQHYRQQQQRQQRVRSRQQNGTSFKSSINPWSAAAGSSDDGNESNGGNSSKNQPDVGYNIHESLEELGRLAETAGLKVVGSTYQALEAPNNATYIGSGKVAEVAQAVAALKVDTVVFDDELSPGQLRNLEKALSGGKDGIKVAVADRTALILDIFSQRAQTREGKLQVELAQVEYQLPRLSRMWTHLDRVSGGGQVKGVGEKQLEIDKRLLRDKAAGLRRELQAVRTHRAAHRSRRSDAPIPVVALVGYTNAGKSTLLNTLTQAGVLAEDKLFATLDPTTRKIRLGNTLEVLISDTVGFIQKLPTQLVAAFRATLEEIAAASVVLHVLDVSAPNAAAQCAAVLQVLEELGVQDLPLVTAWNKMDACPDPAAVQALATSRPDTVAMSGVTGEGLQELLTTIAGKLAESMVEMEVLLPYSAGALLDDVHKMGKVLEETYTEAGTRVRAQAPRCLVGKLQQYDVECSKAGNASNDNSTSTSALEYENEVVHVVDVDSFDNIADGGSWSDTHRDWQGNGGLTSSDAGASWHEVDESISGSWNQDPEVAAAVKAIENSSSKSAYRQKKRGSRASKRLQQQQEQQRSSLSKHQLPSDWQERVLSRNNKTAADARPKALV